MQALIDFDGWRKWKDLAAREEASKKGESKADQKAALKAMFSQAPRTRKEKERDAREREKDHAEGGEPVGAGGGGPAAGGGATGPGHERTRSPANVRKVTGRNDSMDGAASNASDGKSDSSTSVNTVTL